jgi:hypothetical protein
MDLARQGSRSVHGNGGTLGLGKPEDPRRDDRAYFASRERSKDANRAAGPGYTSTQPAKARAEVAAYADCTESQMMAMFGWTDPKMPAHYIAQANRQRLGVTGMDKVVAFDRTHALGDGSGLSGAPARSVTNMSGTKDANGVVTFPGNNRKKI